MRWGKLYRESLVRAIAWADRFFGPALSQRAFGACLIVALVYGYYGFSVAYMLGGPGNLASTELMPRLDRIQQALGSLSWMIATTLVWFLGFCGGRCERWRRRRWLKKQRSCIAKPTKPNVDAAYHLRSAIMVVGSTVIATIFAVFMSDLSNDFLLKWLTPMACMPAVLLGTAWAIKLRSIWAGPLALLGGAGAALALSGAFIALTQWMGPNEAIFAAVVVTLAILARTIVVAGTVPAALGPLAIAFVLGLNEAVSLNMTGGQLLIAGIEIPTTPSDANTFMIMAAWSVGASQGYWPIGGRLGWGIAVGLSMGFGLLSAAWATTEIYRIFLLVGVTLYTLLPFLNGLLDMVSWLWTRWLAGRLLRELDGEGRGEARAATVLVHTFLDLVLAIFSLVLLAWLLAFAFELYGQLCGAVAGGSDHGSYVRPMIDDAMNGPWQNGFWIWLMLLSTLVPTAIHMTFLLFAPLTVVALSDTKRRELILRLEDFDQAERSEQTTTVRKVASYFARERHLVWSAAIASIIVGPLGLFTVIVQMTEWQASSNLINFLHTIALNGIDVAHFLIGL